MGKETYPSDMSSEQRAEMERIAEQVRTLREGGGSTDRDAVATVARDAALPIIKLDKNSQGKQIWSVGSMWKKPKFKAHGGYVKKYAKGGGVRKVRS